jgi:hypothetical protein
VSRRSDFDVVVPCSGRPVIGGGSFG